MEASGKSGHSHKSQSLSLLNRVVELGHNIQERAMYLLQIGKNF